MPDSEAWIQRIEAFLKSSQTDKKDRAFVPSRTAIRQFADREQRLIDYMKAYDAEEEFRGRDLPLFSEVIPGTLGKRFSMDVMNAQIPEELGINHVSLHAFEGKPELSPFYPPYAPSVFESDVSAILTVGKHMDAKTQPQVSHLLDRDQILISSLQTLYVIDPSREPQNMVGKISVFPRQVFDKRIEVSDREMALKHVLSEVTEEDISVIDQSLVILETYYFGPSS